MELHHINDALRAAIADACPCGDPDRRVHRGRLRRSSTSGRSSSAICTARPSLGVSERALSVLNALLTFHPETALTGEDDLVVFPSNQQLSLRAHGMPASTLRRHLAVLVEAGLDHPPRQPQRQALRSKKGRGGEIEMAFGFDLSPLVVRARRVRESGGRRAKPKRVPLSSLRERITLCRRDIAKMIATGIEEGVPTHKVGQGTADWAELHTVFRVDRGGDSAHARPAFSLSRSPRSCRS